MTLLNKAAARCGLVFCALAITASASATTLPTQSWNGYHWAHTGNLAIMVGNNTASKWSSYLSTAEAAWSTNQYIDFVASAGMTSASSCASVYGTIQVCSGNYGATGWSGWTTVTTSGTQITAATIKLNDYYFTQAKYNNAAYFQQVICQELGNALGLDDSDHNYTNANTGSCMDYSNDPSGTKGTNGTLVNIAPNASDMTNLNAIYSVYDKTQLVFTVPKTSGNAQAASVPEPASWGMMLVGFGALGLSMRRRRKQTVAVAFAR
jgi:hypothetical protein